MTDPISVEGGLPSYCNLTDRITLVSVPISYEDSLLAKDIF